MDNTAPEKRWFDFKCLIGRIDSIQPSSERLDMMVQSDGFDQMTNVMLAEIEDQEQANK